MRFAHPEFFYAFFALLLPILVHLFQLRRFKTKFFTNIAFLERINLQTRKSSTLKKWIILSLRMLAISCIVLAFTQPFISNSNAKNELPEVVIYLDNSFSMEAEGSKGPLLKQAIQQLLTENIPFENITIFTNSKTYKNRRLSDLKTELLDITYSNRQLSFEAVLNKGSSLFTKQKNNQKYLILISDFQKKEEDLKLPKDIKYQLFLVKKIPVSRQNNFIEKIEISSELNAYQLNVYAKTQSNDQDSIAISLFNANRLIGKSLLKKSKDFKTSFSLPKNESIKGKMILEDSGLSYDNTFYFNIRQSPKISVLTIADKNPDYFQRIFTKEAFTYNFASLETLNYKSLQKQDLIVISELNRLPDALLNNLKSFVRSNGTVLFIPASGGDIVSYNAFLNELNLKFNSLRTKKKKITTINFEHPVYKRSFEKPVRNFQYPNVIKQFGINTAAKILLGLEDGQPLLIQKEQCFIFTAPIGPTNSNFTNSPIVVPTIYEIGKFSFKLPKLQYELGEKNELELKYNLKDDGVLKLSQKKETFIPLQTKQNSKIKLFFDDLLEKAGHYALYEKSDTLQYLSFNQPRNESLLQYYNLEKLSSDKVFSSVDNTLKSIKSEVIVKELWKWFVIFALIFLVLEMLILKFSE